MDGESPGAMIVEAEHTRRPRCALVARQSNLDPAGTAPSTDVFVLVEHPFPWPREIAGDPLLARIEAAALHAAGVRSVRLQALAVDAAEATRRIVVLAATAPFLGYARLEGCGLPDELPGIAGALVAADPPEPVPGRVTDVLICTHGARDACCGSMGTRLWRAAEHAGANVWRTSHTGGHRFAPTAVTFPDGNYWAHLDPDLLAGIVSRSLSPRVAAKHLRGCAALAPPLQVADRAVFAARGWDWLACARIGTEHSPHRVHLCFESTGVERGCYDVCLAEARRVPIPDCGGGPATTSKTQSEWRVTRLERWS
jgi:hypothetical protein